MNNMISKWRVTAMLSYLESHIKEGDLSRQQILAVIKNYRKFVNEINEEKEQEEIRIRGYY